MARASALTEGSGAATIRRVSRDDTAGRKAEAELRERNEELRLAVDAGGVGLWDWDLRTNQVFFSDEWKRQLGYSQGEVANRYEEWEKRVHPDDLKGALEAIGRTLESPHPPYRVTFRLRHRDGSYRWIKAQGSLRLDPEGNPFRFVGSHLDITEQKQTEATLVRRALEREILVRASRALTETLELPTVLQRITEHAARLLNVGTSAIYLVDAEEMFLGATTPPLPPQFPDALRRGRLSDHPHIRQTVSTGKVVHLPDAEGAPLSAAERQAVEARAMRTLVYVPLAIGSSNIGVLILATVGEPREIREDDLDPIRTLANQAAIAIQNARLLEESQRQRAQAEALAARSQSTADQRKYELELSEERYRQLVDSSPDALIVDCDGAIVFANPAAVRLTGAADASELLETSIDERLGLDSAHQAAGPTLAAAADRMEGRLLRVDGKVVAVEITQVATTFRGRAARQTTARDITERKKADARRAAQYGVAHTISHATSLEEAAARILRDVCEPIGWAFGELWQIDEASEALRCTASWHRLGSQGDRFVEICSEIAYVRGEDLPGRVWATEEPLWLIDVLVEPSFCRKAEAEALGLHAAAAAPVESDGRIIGVLQFFAQEAKAQDEALLSTLATISAAVSQLIERLRAETQLREATAEAEQANRAKSEFLSRMSHELRTPLNAILGFSQILSLGDLAEKPLRNVEQINKAGHHLLDLINEVLDISRIDTGRMTLSPEPVAIAPAIIEAVELMRPLASKRDIDIASQVPTSNAVCVLADRQRLKQVLLNLLSNAIKYNRDGGRIRVEAAQREDGMVRVSVQDNGLGIAPEYMDRLFVPFERLDAESRTHQEGTGLGLALSKGLVGAMGGEMGAESKLREGSTFWFALKQASPPKVSGSPLRPTSSMPVASGQRALVLYVEDNLANIELVEAIIELTPGIELTTTMQGHRALELAAEHKPDLILLDLHLPDMNGVEVLQQLQAEVATSSIPVIVVSADASPSQRERLLAMGACDYLSKPLDVRAFRAALESIRRGI